MKSLASVNNIINFVLETLFPSKCLSCGKKNEILCDLCVSKIKPAERETEEKIFSVFDYRDPVIKKAIWELKYYKKKHTAERLGQLLHEFLLEEIANMRSINSGQAFCIIPVPISNKKTRLRGYNQSYAIAKSFCEHSDDKIFELKNNIITKEVETLPQARLKNRQDRLKNIKGVFGIKNKKEIKGRTIIIIDDVTTTGGTILEIMKILKQAGAKKVVGFTVAH